MVFLSMIIVGLILGSMLGWELNKVWVNHKRPNNVRFYVARDKDEKLWLYIGKPVRGDDRSFVPNTRGKLVVGSPYFIDFGLNKDDYKDLKWEDEPVEVFLNLED